MEIPVTAFAASTMALWLVWLSARVISARGSEGITLGTGENDKLERRVRAQANFSEYVPIALILLMIAELQSANFLLLALCAGLLVFGRLIHGIALSFTEKWIFGRVGGMLATFASIIILAALNLYTLIL